jgi:hypothetical protein
MKYLACTHFSMDNPQDTKFWMYLYPGSWRAIDRFGKEQKRIEDSDTILSWVLDGSLKVVDGVPQFDEEFEYPRVFQKTVCRDKLYYILEKDWTLNYICELKYSSATLFRSQDVSCLGDEVTKEVRQVVLQLRDAILKNKKV